MTHGIGIATAQLTGLLSATRTGGWRGKWNQMTEDPQQKIGRPRQLYTGHTKRMFKPIHKR